MNILIVAETYYPRLRGGEVVLWSVSRSLVQKGHSVQVITSRLINTSQYEKKLGVQIYRPFPLVSIGKTIKIKNLLEKISYNLKIYEFLKSFILKNKIDIIYNQAYPLTYVTSRIAYKKKIPLILSVGSYTKVSLKKIFYDRVHIFHVAKQIITLKSLKYEVIRTGSNFMKKRLKKYTDKSISIIPSPVDENLIHQIKLIDKKRLRKEVNISDDELFIIFVGALEPVKNVKTIIKVLSKIKRKFKFIIIGDGSEKTEIQHTVMNNQLNDRVTLLGQKEYKDTLKYIKSSDILLLGSESEACGNVIIEALCLETSVISTKTGIAADLCSVNLHTVNNINDFIPLIENWINHNNPEEIIEKFSNKNISRLYEKMFKKVIYHYKT